VVVSFFERYSFQLRQGEEDRIRWNPSKRSMFEVKLFYQVLNNLNRPSFLWESIWRIKAPLRVAFFVWTTLGKIVTLDNLIKGNIVVFEWCCMCKRSGESIDHLLIHCEVAIELRSSILNLICVEWVNWGEQVGRGTVMGVWRLVPLCLMWCHWREMNARSFENVGTSVTVAEDCDQYFILLDICSS
jgi:hypothetical protein